VVVDINQRSGSAVFHPAMHNGTQVAEDSSPRRTQGQATHHDGIYAVCKIVVLQKEERDRFCSSTSSKAPEESGEIACIEAIILYIPLIQTCSTDR
jgi:hypothetical protein